MAYGLLGLLVLCLLDCAASSASIPHGATPLAMSAWNCAEKEPHTFYREDVREDRARYAEVRAHEEMHKVQMKRYGCSGWNHAYSTSAQFREDAESEAFCAMARRAVEARRMSFAQALDHYAIWLSGSTYDGDYAYSVQRILRFC